MGTPRRGKIARTMLIWTVMALTATTVAGCTQVVRGRAVLAGPKVGQPVELHVVPGKGHEFLFRGEEWKATLKFLDALKPLGKAKKDAHPGGGSEDSQLP